MSFEFSIKCSKDIKSLHIDFADGTSSIVENKPKVSKKVEQKSFVENNHGDFLDTDVEFSNASNEVIKPPEIIRENKSVKVAEELQNFDF